MLKGLDFRPHPQVVRPEIKGFSPGLKNMSPAFFLPSLCAGRPLRIPTHKNKNRVHLHPVFILVEVSGFEPEVSWTRTKRDTKLRHTSIAHVL